MMRACAMTGVLVIVPCGQKKIWDCHANTGQTAARDAYTGAPFRINRAYAEVFSNAWIILSAKYGFIEPGFGISGPYNITFKKKGSVPITAQELLEQVRFNNFARFTTIIGLGGKIYRETIQQAFADSAPRLHFPFSGLPIGMAMQSTKRAIATNDPLWKNRSDQ